MHTEGCPSMKLSGELDVSSTANNTSLPEDDLALSSSTLGLRDKSLEDRSEVASRSYNPSGGIIYVNEETMDCSYSQSAVTPRDHDTRNEVSSPEMFDSDDEDDDKNKGKDFKDSLSRQRDEPSMENSLLTEKSTITTNEELIAKSDCYLLSRMNKFLTGVPPPPKHTICQIDCADLLARIRANREYFLIDPLDDPCDKDTNFDDEKTRLESNKVEKNEKRVESSSENKTACINDKTIKTTDKIAGNSPERRSLDNHRGKSSLRNLTNAFDACDPMDESSMTITSLSDESTREKFSEKTNDCLASNENINDKMRKNNVTEREIVFEESSSIGSNVTTSETNRNKDRRVTFKMPENEPVRFCSTIRIEDVKDMAWELAYGHKTHGIHYNRSKTVEEFDGLRLKLCQRYIGAETQSSCNIWFTKQTPGSVKKRNLLSRRNSGQSPGKRLSHLARRRRTFSSANLQGLGMVDKKQLVLNIKKPTIRKGKSPRGKSPRGSAKKRAGLRRISPSPRKTKLETSKRALFQSPPGDRAGPSNVTINSHVNANSQLRIKRALFPTTKTREEESTGASSTIALETRRALIFEDTRKRKSDDDLEGPRFKWAKSLSFDCPHVADKNSSDLWTNERHSTGNFHMKSQTPIQQAKSEFSEVHRKKLLWAVAEALRGKGISMGHPRFKQCASQLARTVKKYMPDLENSNLPRKPGSTSDRMLRLAKRHVLLIVESKSAE